MRPFVFSSAEFSSLLQTRSAFAARVQTANAHQNRSSLLFPSFPHTLSPTPSTSPAAATICYTLKTVREVNIHLYAAYIDGNCRFRKMVFIFLCLKFSDFLNRYNGLRRCIVEFINNFFPRVFQQLLLCISTGMHLPFPPKGNIFFLSLLYRHYRVYFIFLI